MPAFYPEGDEPKLADHSGRSLHKINNRLKSIDTKTGSTTITGPVTVSNEVEVTNSTGNPIPVSGTVALDSTSLAALENISVTFPQSQNVNVTNAGLSVSVSNLPATQPISGSVSVSNFPATQPVSLATAPTTPVTGTFWQATQPVSLASAPVTPVTDNGGSLTVDGTVTANVSGTVPVSGTFWQTTQPISGTVTASVSNFSSIASDIGGNAPPIGIQLGFSAGEEDFRHVTSTSPLPISGTVTTYPQQGSTVTNTTFSSATSATLASADSTREVLTVHNEGPATLFINVGSSASTTSYQVCLLAGDYWEAPAGQQSLQHSGIFSSAGTARVTQIS